MGFGGTPTAPPPLPPRVDETKVKKDARKRLRQGSVKKQTVLTSPLGVQDSATTKKPTILGAS